MEAHATEERILKFLQDEEIGELGCRMSHLTELKGQAFVKPALEALETLQVDVLDYKFKNPLTLLAALTHRSAKSHHQLT